MSIVNKSDGMDVRKLQLVGRASFSVTLPPDWVKGNNLKPGDQVTLTQEDDGSIRLVRGVAPEEKELKITIDADRCKQSGLLTRLIVGGYIRGCDLIDVVSQHRIRRDQKDEIQDTVNGLLGLGIMEMTSNKVVIQSLVDHSKFPIRPLLKRLCGLASSMHKDAMQALKDKDLTLAADIAQRENEVNKIYWLAVRQLVAAALNKSLLQKVGLPTTHDPADYRTVAVRLEAIADCAEDIAKGLLALGKKGIANSELQKVVQLSGLAHDAYHNACEAFFKEDMVMANTAVEIVDNFEDRAEELIREVSTRIEDVHVGTCLMTIIRDICTMAECGKRIAEITINNSVSKKGELP